MTAIARVAALLDLGNLVVIVGLVLAGNNDALLQIGVLAAGTGLVMAIAQPAPTRRSSER